MTFEPRFAVTNAVAADLTRMSDRQALALGHVMEHGRLAIRDYEQLCPGTNRRTLQRDLKALVGKGLVAEAATATTDPTRHYRPADGLQKSETRL